MAISASMVKELRERTGAGMMECKKALVETGGDIDGAIEHLRKSGQAKADKKATKSSKKLKAELELSDLEKTLSVLDANQRKSVLADEKVFRAFVKQEADNVSILIAARANKVDQSEKTLILAQRGVDNIVREFVKEAASILTPLPLPRTEASIVLKVELSAIVPIVTV